MVCISLQAENRDVTGSYWCYLWLSTRSCTSPRRDGSSQDRRDERQNQFACSTLWISVLQTRASGQVFFRNERQEGWLEDLESTFRHFGRVTNEIPFDNDRGFVSRRAVATREVTLTRDFWPSLEGSGHGPPLRLPDNVAREATGGAVS